MHSRKRSYARADGHTILVHLPDNGGVQNVVTLELLARLHPGAEPERRTWWVHEPGTGSSTQPIPGVCVLPFWQLVGKLVARLGHDLERDRIARGQRRRDLEGIGRLAADDIEWLQTAGTLVVSTDSGLLAIRTVLDTLVQVQPGLVEVAEHWREWLDLESKQLLPGSRFELRLGALFTEGTVFERVLSYRVFDAARFFTTCEGASSAEQLRTDMTLLLASIGQVPGDTNPEAQHLAALRRAVTYNKLDDFLALVDLSDPSQAKLLIPAYGAAIAAAPQRRVALIVERAHVAAAAESSEVRLVALREGVDAVHELRASGATDEAAVEYRRLLDAYAGDFLEDNEFLEPWFRLLANLSYLYIKKQDNPQAALELLLPRLQAFDAREERSATRNDPDIAGPLSRVRANMDAAVAKLQERGATIPPGVGANLSTADRAELDRAMDAFATALAAPEPRRARDIAERALALLTEREVPTDTLRYTEWHIDWARAVRDQGDLERAATTLRDIVDRCASAPSMALRASGGRASVALGVTYRRLGRPADEMAAYEEFLSSAAASETTRSTLVQVSLAHANLGETLARSGDPTRAVGQYLAAARAAQRLGDEQQHVSLLTRAAETARLAGDEAKEHSIRAKLGPASPRRAVSGASRGFLNWLRGRH